MKKIIVIVGPTGSGKSDFAIEVSKIFDCEIINADCFQVYKYLNIGVNKTTDFKGIKHHLIDILDPNEEWDIKKFKEQAEHIIDNSNKNIIVTGGSNLYIDCLIKNYNLSNTKRQAELGNFSNQELYNQIKSKDSSLAQKIGINNRKRLERACELTLNENLMNQCLPKKYKSYIIFINPKRDLLYQKINDRVDKMILNNWLDEIKWIIEHYRKDCNALQAIGYKTIINNDCILSEQVIDKVKQETRRYAKRQISWCKNKFDVALEKDNAQLTKDDINSIRSFLND